MPNQEPREVVESNLRVLKSKRSYVKRTLTILDFYLRKDKTASNLQSICKQYEQCQKSFQHMESFAEEVYDPDYEDQFDQHFQEKMVIDDLFATATIEYNKLNFNTPHQGQMQPTTSHVKLPPLSLPTFSGKFEDWFSFYETFKQSVDSNVSLSNIEKLQYLRGSLRHEALEVIKNLECNNDNYVNAVELLRDRFENKRILISNHVRALFDLNSVSKESFQAYRQLIDSILQHMRSLAAIGRPVEQWDDLLIHLTLSKLPLSTRREWENKIEIREIPTFKKLTDFLIHRCHTLTALQSKDFENNSHLRSHTKGFSKTQFSGEHKKIASCQIAAKAISRICYFCNAKTHYINQCDQYLQLAVNDRLNFVNAKNLCTNCLRKGHSHGGCQSSRCRVCNSSHNTTLHRDIMVSNDTGAGSSIDINSHELSASHSALVTDFIAFPDVLLATCVVDVKDTHNNYHKARIVLDPGSTINIVSRSFQEKLNLSVLRTNVAVSGVDEICTATNEAAQIVCRSRFGNFTLTTFAVILNRVCNNLPHRTVNANSVFIPNDIRLADPKYFQSSEINILIGAEHCFSLYRGGQIRTNVPGLLLQNSDFGWLLSGPLPFTRYKQNHSCNLLNLDNTLSKFWEIESVPNARFFNDEEQKCEEHFSKSVERNPSGRFVVGLPWKVSPECLGNSYDMALNRFLRLEKKLSKDSAAKADYDKFMQEYLDLEHMKLIDCISKVQSSDDHFYYMPHHAVYKKESLTTKVRVVFDASAPSSNNISLNDILLKGPVIQDDIFSILIRFRFHRYVVSADIGKMYRQILINENDSKYHRILHRFAVSEDIKVYELKTLTYGTRPASFIATRCLKEISNHVRLSDQHLAEVISSDFYMDDLITGSDNIDELKLFVGDISRLFNQYGFSLMKWCSNSSYVLQELQSWTQENLVIKSDSQATLKTLGVSWRPTSDTIIYNHKFNNSLSITKRELLSQIAQIFDPLGLLGPIITDAKIIMQEVWKLNLGWDQSIPANLQARWFDFCTNLNHLSDLKIPRGVRQTDAKIELHCFADASEKAYGTCVYIRQIYSDDSVSCNLLCSKSRVAPLKTITVPRLELCAALLAAELVDKLLHNIKFHISKLCFYTDSTIVLHWINDCPSNLKIFVANRIAKIQGITDVKNWFHVSGTENPADILSRGCNMSQLIEFSTWWYGPPFLHSKNFEPISFAADKEFGDVEICLYSQSHKSFCDQAFYDNVITRYSSFTKLLRVFAYCKRFLYNSSVKNKSERRLSHLSVQELNEAELHLIRLVQHLHFYNEIVLLRQNKIISKQSNLLSLSPYLDDNQILRVGGRLTHSHLDDYHKHQILLPKRDPFSDLVILDAHARSLHSGVLGTLALIRLKYWIISARSAVKRITQNCIICFKSKPSSGIILMGDLPPARTQVARPFSRTGVDFFGPFLLKEGSRRSKKYVKGYGCVFVCFITKAVHCELVEDLSTEAFLAALDRFVARRGIANEIYCDNATNFQGAANELRQCLQFLKKSDIQADIIAHMASIRVSFMFIPPRAPNFGGIWEAAVKSFKRVISKLVVNSHLTYIELYTLLVETEAVLNSRPLSPISPDPNDCEFLTPGHFLVGENILAIPRPSLLDVRENCLSRWQRVQQLHQHFWKRWQREYLQEMQRRQKWTTSSLRPLSAGDMVIIIEDNTPPRLWKLGRIVAVHPGADGIIRVATVRTAHGEYKRPATRLCPLPMPESMGDVV